MTLENIKGVNVSWREASSERKLSDGSNELRMKINLEKNEGSWIYIKKSLCFWHHSFSSLFFAVLKSHGNCMFFSLFLTTQKNEISLVVLLWIYQENCVWDWRMSFFLCTFCCCYFHNTSRLRSHNNPLYRFLIHAIIDFYIFLYGIKI